MYLIPVYHVLDAYLFPIDPFSSYQDNVRIIVLFSKVQAYHFLRIDRSWKASSGFVFVFQLILRPRGLD
jgi:hypothetical protein